jgi:hypothetical protein
MRDVILRHPWITSLFGLRPNIGPNAMRLIDRTLASLTAAGFDAREATYAASLLSAHAIGSATTESAWHTAVARSGMSAEDLARSIEDYERAMAGDYPHLDSWTREVGPLDVGELQKQTFAYGLDRILDGLEASVRCSRH